MHASNSAIYQTIYELQTPLHNTFLKKTSSVTKIMAFIFKQSKMWSCISTETNTGSQRL